MLVELAGMGEVPFCLYFNLEPSRRSTPSRTAPGSAYCIARLPKNQAM